MGEEILDLSKITDHDTIRMPDGKQHELINRTDLGIFEYHKLTSMQAEATKLTAAAAKGPLTPPQARKLMKVLGDLVKLLVPTINSAMLGKLERPAREQIILVWLSRNFEPEELSGEVPSRRTTAASSPGSKRSTAATRKRGSTRRSGR